MQYSFKIPPSATITCWALLTASLTFASTSTLPIIDNAKPKQASPYSENALVWTFPATLAQGSEAERTVYFNQDEALVFNFPLESPEHPLRLNYEGLTERNQPRTIQLYVNGNTVGQPIQLTDRLTEHRVNIPESITLSNPLRVEVHKVLGQNPVAHSLGVAQGISPQNLPKIITSVPESFHTVHYDDVGVIDRQPHVQGGRIHTFSRAAVPEATDRSVAFDPYGFSLIYANLPENQDYILELGITADSAPRTQSILIQDHIVMNNVVPEPGKQTEHFFSVPGAALRDGTLTVEITKNRGHNALLAYAVLWTDGDALPTTVGPTITHEIRLDGDLKATLLDARYQPIPNASLSIKTEDGETIATETTNEQGVVNVKHDHLSNLNNHQFILIQADTMKPSTIPLSDIRAPRYAFPEIPESLAGVRSPTLSLDGEWSIEVPAPSDPSGFSTDQAKSAQVPGQWQQQGFIQNKDETVMVQRRFELPADWSGQRVHLRFDSIHGNCIYWINGKRLGNSTRLYTPIDFDITEFIKAGAENTLTVFMELGSAAETLSHTSEYAKHSLLGIDRSVFLYALPAVSIDSLHLWSEHSNSYQDAELVADFTLTTPDLEHTAIRVELVDPSGNAVSMDQFEWPINALPHRGDRYKLSIPVPEPKLWNAETPHLYELTVTPVYEGKPLMKIEKQVGLRELEVEGTHFLVNGQPIKLRGINRHEIHPLTGRADTMKWARRDAELFKQANVNYIRTSHYPPPREFMEACDELGIYVQIEAPFCWTRGKGEADDKLLPVWAEASAAMVEYHRNHPSNIIWSLANESNPNPDSSGFVGLKSNYEKLAHWYPVEDPHRPTTINNEWNNNGGLTDIANIHYPPHTFENNPDIKGEDRPVLIDEHMHINCYNIEELLFDPGVAEEWAEMKLSFGRSYPKDPMSPESIVNRMENSDLFLGGAIWGGVDEIFILPDEEVGYGAWGIIDGWRRKKPEWWHTRMIYSPIWIPTRTAQLSGREASFEVENRFHFTTLSELSVKAYLNGSAIGTFSLPQIEPGRSGEVSLTLPEDSQEGDLLVVDFENAQAESIATWGLYLNQMPNALPIYVADSGVPVIERTEAGWTIQTKNTLYQVDAQSGCIKGGSFRDRPYPHFTQKESKNWFVPEAPPYLQLPNHGQISVESVSVEAHGDSALITIRDNYPEISGETHVAIDEDDHIQVKTAYTFNGEKPMTIRELGVRLPLMNTYETISWSRQGYWNHYPEGHLGRLQGTAQATNPKTQDLAMSPKFNVAIEEPSEDWTQDPSRFGTRDFRASKLNFDWARMQAPDSTVEFRGTFEQHIRPAIAPDGVNVFINQSNPETHLKPGDHREVQVSLQIQ